MKNEMRAGQVLVEIIIAALLLIFITLTIAEVAATSLRGINQTLPKVNAVFLAQEEAEAIRAAAKEDWHLISNLSTSSPRNHCAQVSGGKWVLSDCTASPELNGITYSQYFTLDDVYRSTSSATSTGNIVSSGGYYDPSTIKATVYIVWTDTFGDAQTYSKVIYYSRFLNTIYSQTDWSGGSVGEASTSVATTTFATSTGINFASTSGSIYLEVQ